MNIEPVTGDQPWGPGPAAVIQRNLEHLSGLPGLQVQDLDGELLNSAAVVTFTLADTEYSFAHTLGRVPTGFIVVGLTLGAVIRGLADGSATNQGTAWTSAAITLVSSVAGEKALIFVF